MNHHVRVCAEDDFAKKLEVPFLAGPSSAALTCAAAGFVALGSLCKVLASTQRDKYRKPNTGMWEHLAKVLLIAS